MVINQIPTPSTDSPYIVQFLVGVVVILLGVIAWFAKNGLSAIKQHLTDLKAERDAERKRLDDATQEQARRFEAAEQSKRERGDRLDAKLEQSDKEIRALFDEESKENAARFAACEKKISDLEHSFERLKDQQKAP